MVHMLLLPFLPITALIVQNSGVLIKQLQYQRDVTEIGRKVEEIKILETFITNLQSERAEVAFYIFTNGSQTLEMNLTTRYGQFIDIVVALQFIIRFQKTDEALSDLVWPEKFHQSRFELEKRNDEKFKSRLRFQISHEDFRQRISQDEEDINSILDWYKLTDSVFLGIILCSVKFNSWYLKSL